LSKPPFSRHADGSQILPSGLQASTGVDSSPVPGEASPEMAAMSMIIPKKAQQMKGPHIIKQMQQQ